MSLTGNVANNLISGCDQRLAKITFTLMTGARQRRSMLDSERAYVHHKNSAARLHHACIFMRNGSMCHCPIVGYLWPYFSSRHVGGFRSGWRSFRRQSCGTPGRRRQPQPDAGRAGYVVFTRYWTGVHFLGVGEGELQLQHRFGHRRSGRYAWQRRYSFAGKHFRMVSSGGVSSGGSLH